MEDVFKRDTCAEIALSAMVSMIMILLFSALVAGMALLMIEQAFMESRSHSVEQSETLNSVPLVFSLKWKNLIRQGIQTTDCMSCSSSHLPEVQFLIQTSNGP